VVALAHCGVERQGQRPVGAAASASFTPASVEGWPQRIARWQL